MHQQGFLQCWDGDADLLGQQPQRAIKFSQQTSKSPSLHQQKKIFSKIFNKNFKSMFILGNNTILSKKIWIFLYKIDCLTL